MTTETKDPVKIMAPYFVSKEGAKHPADVRARTVIAALDAAGYAIVPKEPNEEMAREGVKPIRDANAHAFVLTAKCCYDAMIEVGRVKP